MSLPRRGRRAPILLLIAGLAVALASCSGGGDAKAAKTDTPEGATLDLTTGPVQVQAAGTPGVLADADKAAIVDTVRRYVIAGTINPLQGKPVGNLGTVFTPAAVTALAGPDGAAALDTGLPKATGDVKATAAPLVLVALSDPGGAINLVGTSLAIDVHADASTGPVRVKRSGELVLAKSGANAWRITSYRLGVTRSGSGLGTTTSSSTGTGAP